MSDPRFTPGPWVASQYFDDGRWGVLTSDGGIVVSTRSSPMHETDALLIAAAPELFEALKFFIEHPGVSQLCTPNSKAMTSAVAAIKKATGA